MKQPVTFDATEIATIAQYCDLKVELYALCNEIDWWMRLGEIDTISYIKMRSRKLIKQIKKAKLKR